MSTITQDETQLPIEQKLDLLYQLQQIDSEIDELNHIKGELPVEVADLENVVANLITKIESDTTEQEELANNLKSKRESIDNSKQLISKYTEQQKEVRNNREYESINKELEYQQLEIELAEKHIKEINVDIKIKAKLIEEIKAILVERKLDLEIKQKELGTIEAETSKELDILNSKAQDKMSKIETNLLESYKSIRNNTRNGLAVVYVHRDACGGCFNRIPPQRQIDISQSKKIIFCEYCGRILKSELTDANS